MTRAAMALATLDLKRLGPQRDVGRAVLTKRDRADMQSSPRVEWWSELLKAA
jgi:hypothetical protein